MSQNKKTKSLISVQEIIEQGGYKSGQLQTLVAKESDHSIEKTQTPQGDETVKIRLDTGAENVGKST